MAFAEIYRMQTQPFSVMVMLAAFGACTTNATQNDVGRPDADDHDAASDSNQSDGKRADVGTDFGFPDVRSQYGIITTVAGAGKEDNGNDWLKPMEGGSAKDAELSRPHIAQADVQGRIFIADKEAHAIRRVDLDGTIHTVAGTGEPGHDGDSALPAANARLNAPNGLWVNKDGSFYVYDTGNDRVRYVSVAGQMTTLCVVGGFWRRTRIMGQPIRDACLHRRRHGAKKVDAQFRCSNVGDRLRITRQLTRIAARGRFL